MSRSAADGHVRLTRARPAGRSRKRAGRRHGIYFRVGPSPSSHHAAAKPRRRPSPGARPAGRARPLDL